ncbi:hypothetical protein CARUB_v10019377mg [Capsella rubella]|uniref:RBR-type E3 ubiquitin transferase n=1 Tax=Capsella rubella TaxID=81985 RepID=R0HPY4_9BRAS|nr:probable E3 ubiquitin-protein ligase ARI3 [Capsella rubella]EOA25988.1 hypothetical protein CARUB_v10019377mg [Capsella rubella]
MKKADAPNRTTAKPSPGDLSCDSYTLYFKGLRKLLIRRGLSSAGFGVAICREDERDNLLFQMNGPLHDSDLLTLWEADLMALKLGLTKALSFGIKHISICFDDDEIFEFAMGRSAPKHEKIASLMDDVQRIRQIFETSIPVLVPKTQTKFVFDLAMEIITGAEKKMISVDSCGHKFGTGYMKKHIELKLNQGDVPSCPRPDCTSNLDLTSCVHLLTPKLKVLWEQRVKEESVAVCDRFHCPNPSCWALMSKTELLESSEDGVKRRCYKCLQDFCINCKDLWHYKLSCEEYKERSSQKASTTVWRQCGSCQHKIKLSKESNTVTCRCGYTFCYKCGAQWKRGGCSHRREFVMDVFTAVIFFFIFLLTFLFIMLI